MRPRLHCLTFGDDGSPASDAAWAWVTAQSWEGWSVDVLRPGMAEGGTCGAPRERAAPRRCGFLRVRELTSPLDPTTALTSHSGTDLLVVGFGGVAERLVARVEVPTVVAREGREVRHVLAYVGDETPSTWSGLDVLTGLPWSDSAVVTVLALTDPARAHVDRAQRVVDHLKSAGLRAELQTASPDTTVVMSRPVHRVVEISDRMQPDLVVLAAPRRSRMARRILGSVALDITRGVSCSVLLTTR